MTLSDALYLAKEAAFAVGALLWFLWFGGFYALTFTRNLFSKREGPKGPMLMGALVFWLISLIGPVGFWNTYFSN